MSYFNKVKVARLQSVGRNVFPANSRCKAGAIRRATLPLLALLLLAPWQLGAQQPEVVQEAHAALPDAPGAPPSAAADVEPSVPQAPATISGTVLDTNGSVVQSAHVELIGPGAGEKHVQDTTGDGAFTFTGLMPGRYKLTVTGQGWGTYIAPEIHINSGEFRIVPHIALPVASAVTDVKVYADRDELAQEQVKIAVQQRVLGVFPNFYSSYDWQAPPMGAKQKFQLAARSLIDPVTFLGVAGVAGAEQIHNNFPGYGGGIQGYAKRFGAAYADDVSADLIGKALLPSLLHQDPRYFYKGTGSTSSRLTYALSSAVMTRSDGGRWEPNYSYILGSFAAGAISNLYYPAGSRGTALVFENGAIGIGAHAATNVVREFVLKRFSSRAKDAADTTP